MRRTRDKRHGIFLSLFLLVSLFSLGPGDGLSQPAKKEDQGPQIELGEVSFRRREIESKPEVLRILELHIEVLNRSWKFGAPANSVKVAVTPKDIKSPEDRPLKNFEPDPEEATITVLIPPRTGRVLIVGFPLPREKISSMTFEIQINPPDGDKKTAIWSGE